jgi:pimeloyl-ACP methyl ester carboxylesterase
MIAQKPGSTPLAADSSPPPRGYFEQVAGSRLLVDKRGEGSPTVVFLPGAGLTGLDYLPIHERVARMTTSVVYDRAGTGWSDGVALPRSSRAVTDELHALLGAITSGPVLLLGHSLGGIYARHYATRFRASTFGLILLDPGHEDYDAYMPPQLTAARKANKFYAALNMLVELALRTGPTTRLLQKLPVIRRYQELYRELFEQEMAQWPAQLRDVLVRRHVSLDWLVVGMREARQLQELYGELRRAGPMPDVPLVVFCSMTTDGFRDAVSSEEPRELVEAEIDAKLRLYSELAGSVPRGQVRRVSSGHVTLPFQQVDAIVEVVRQMIGRPV